MQKLGTIYILGNVYVRGYSITVKAHRGQNLAVMHVAMTLSHELSLEASHNLTTIL